MGLSVVYWGGGRYLFVVCVSYLTTGYWETGILFVGCRRRVIVDHEHASLSRRSIVPTTKMDTSNVCGLITFLPYIAPMFCLS